jgi:hypothetical protein
LDWGDVERVSVIQYRAISLSSGRKEVSPEWNVKGAASAKKKRQRAGDKSIDETVAGTKTSVDLVIHL